MKQLSYVEEIWRENGCSELLNYREENVGEKGESTTLRSY